MHMSSCSEVGIWERSSVLHGFRGRTNIQRREGLRWWSEGGIHFYICPLPQLQLDTASCTSLYCRRWRLEKVRVSDRTCFDCSALLIFILLWIGRFVFDELGWLSTGCWSVGVCVTGYCVCVQQPCTTSAERLNKKRLRCQTIGNYRVGSVRMGLSVLIRQDRRRISEYPSCFIRRGIITSSLRKWKSLAALSCGYSHAVSVVLKTHIYILYYVFFCVMFLSCSICLFLCSTLEIV